MEISDYLTAKKIYDELAYKYDDSYSYPIHLIEDKYIYSYLFKNGFNNNLLDLGCGTGAAYFNLQDFNEKFIYCGIDISPKMIEIANQKKALQNKEWEICNFSCQDMASINLPDNSFNNIISLFGSFSYCKEPRKAINEIYRLLKPGGKFFIMAMGQRYKNRPSYILNRLSIQSPAIFYNQSHLKSLFQQFDNIKISGMTLLSEFISKLLKSHYKTALKYHIFETKFLGRLLPDNCYFLNITGEKPCQ